METIAEFIQRAADRTGFVREKYIEKNIPTSYANLMVAMFFGDAKSEFVLSSLLMHRFQRMNDSKYVILCGLPKHGALFPGVNEYWGIKDEGIIAELYDSARGFFNLSEKVKSYERQLNRFFEDVRTGESFETYYKHGLTTEYFNKFASVICELPAIGSPRTELSRQLSIRAGYKVFIYPTRVIRSWRHHQEHVFPCSRDFWVALIGRLLTHNIVPVIWHGPGCYDVSGEFGEKCLYGVGDVGNTLATMRAAGCVLDIMSGISRWAIAARTPFICCSDRQRHNELKEYEIDDLCCGKLPYQYIFSIATMIESGQWLDLADIIATKIDKFVPSLNRDEWPTTSESSLVVPYSVVRQNKKKRIGARFIKVPKM